MISKRYFTKRQNLQLLFLRYNIYAIDSIAKKGVVYAMDKNKFALFTGDGYAFCPIHEMPKLADMLKSEEMKKEVISLHEDIKYLQNMRVNYESVGN